MTAAHVDPDKIVGQVRKLQDHLRSNDQTLLGLSELASVCVATTFVPDWQKSIQNRKSYTPSFISHVANLKQNSIAQDPVAAGHLLMCAHLSDAATTSTHFLDFCDQLETEPSVRMQTLYFMLPFAISNRSHFNGSSYFGKWFPELESYKDYSKFEALSSMCDAPEYEETIAAIYRKLEFDFSHTVHDDLAERHGLRAERPAAPKDHVELQKDLMQNVEKLRTQVARTDMVKIPEYAATMQKLQSCLVRGTVVKAKILQKRVAQSAQLLNSMELNPIDESVLRADLTSQYEKMAPEIMKKQQHVRRSSLQENNEMWAYDFNPLKSPSVFTLDELEQKVELMNKVNATLSKYV